MLQHIDGLDVYVVDFDTMPELPITGEGEESKYAIALTSAIKAGIVTEPGKYGIHITLDADESLVYNIFAINE